jgi:hypothetical protein
LFSCLHVKTICWSNAAHAFYASCGICQLHGKPAEQRAECCTAVAGNPSCIAVDEAQVHPAAAGPGVPQPVGHDTGSAPHTPIEESKCFLLPQVLVYHDLLGMMQHPHHAKVTPKFCKQFGAVGEVSVRLSSNLHSHFESTFSCKHLAAECTSRSTP